MNALLHGLFIAVEHRRRVLSKVDRERSGMGVEWETRAIGQDSRSRPTAENRVRNTVGIPQQVVAVTNRQVVNVVRTDNMPRVEEGIGAAGPKIGQIANQALSAEGELVRVVDDVRLVVDRM